MLHLIHAILNCNLFHSVGVAVVKATAINNFNLCNDQINEIAQYPFLSQVYKFLLNCETEIPKKECASLFGTNCEYLIVILLNKKKKKYGAKKHGQRMRKNI